MEKTFLKFRKSLGKITKNWKDLTFYEKSQLSAMLILGILAFLVAYKQVGISDRLLKIEEMDREPVLSMEIGDYEVGNYLGDETKDSIIVNPTFQNTGSVPIKILGSGFNINKADSFGRTFITYTRGQAGINIPPNGEGSLRYEIRASEDRLSEYRFDVVYRREPAGKDKCFSIILFRGEEKLIPVQKNIIECP